MKYFTLQELTESAAAKRLKIDNRPSVEASQSLIYLGETVLDPARGLLGNPIKVNSGYRSPELNKAVKGAPNSQHMKGEAADVTSSDNSRLFEILKSLPFDQLIWEQGGKWIHVSVKRAGNRKQILYL